MVCAIRSVFTINSALLFACKRQNKTNPKCEYFCSSVLFEKVKALQGTCDEFCFEVFPQKRLLEGLMSRSETILKCFFHMIRALNRSAGWVIIFV